MGGSDFGILQADHPKMLLDAGVDFIGKVLLGSLVETEGGHRVKMI
jgi:hypothetical protein